MAGDWPAVSVSNWNFLSKSKQYKLDFLIWYFKEYPSSICYRAEFVVGSYSLLGHFKASY